MAVTPKLGIRIIEGDDLVNKEVWNQNYQTIDEKALHVEHEESKMHFAMWQPATDYSLLATVRTDEIPSFGVFVCTKAGQSGSIPPKGLGVGDKATDGTVEWELRQIGSLGQSVSVHEQLEGRDEPEQHPIEAITDLAETLLALKWWFVEDIATRDNLADKYEGMQVFVLEAEDDATVDDGWAIYLYNEADNSWTKIADRGSNLKTHTELEGREEEDQHPIAAISELEEELGKLKWHFVEDIAARDALQNLYHETKVLVHDATADPEIEAGWVIYQYDESSAGWKRVAEKGSGTKAHEELEGRDKENQHPIKAITGLEEELGKRTWYLVADITERDELFELSELHDTTKVIVQDASADPEVEEGWAIYFYIKSTGTWYLGVQQGGGTKAHSELTGRDLPEQHPIGAIEDLAEELDKLKWLIVADIAERDSLTDLPDGVKVIVQDAEADAEIDQGWAIYRYDESLAGWEKIIDGGAGVFQHPDLTGRELPDQHPIAAIEGLEEALARCNWQVVADIAERDDLEKYSGLRVFVHDAGADETVEEGWAAYVYNLSSGSWTKVAEGESLDVVLEWSNIQNVPAGAAEKTLVFVNSAVHIQYPYTGELTGLTVIAQKPLADHVSFQLQRQSAADYAAQKDKWQGLGGILAFDSSDTYKNYEFASPYVIQAGDVLRVFDEDLELNFHWQIKNK